MNYKELSAQQLFAEYERVSAEYNSYKAKGLKLDISRGKPSEEQLDASLGLLSKQRTVADCKSADGFDCRNYGIAFGMPEMKAIFSDITGIPADNIIVGGNSSLNMMYDSLARAMIFGVYGSPRPWCREERIKFLCPAPGYDRHFAVTETLGFELIPVKMNADGPDMDEVEALVKDPEVKGIWCVPKYSNPTGITYSDEVVRRLAKMETGAPDFRIMWDNAYIIHDLCGDSDELLDIFAEAKKYGNEDRIFYFTSTSKITFPGAGVAMLGASKNNLDQIKPLISIQTIGPDKLNQLRHVEFLKDKEGVLSHMKLHAELLGKRFDILLNALKNGLGGLGIAEWNEPKGGYFVSLDTLPGCAKRAYTLAKEAGVTLTTVGATFPYGKDPEDKNLRLAPSYPSCEELALASQILVCVIKLASLEKMLNK